MIYDRLLRERAAAGKPIRVGMFGAGFMAKGITNQIVNSVPGMELVVICNRNIEKARKAFEIAGVQDIEEAKDDAALAGAMARGASAITSDPLLLCRADLDCLIDATGAIEYGAMITLAAIENGKHMVSMNAELDGTVGPLLKRKADAAGVIFTGADGDQPGVQMNLYRFVVSIGLTPLVCGNVKGLQDPYRNPTTQEGFAKQWGQDPAMVTSFADGTKISFEQAIVANATGMTVTKRGMIGMNHPGHVDELTTMYDVEQLRACGGAVDYVVGSKPGPGVYVLATHDDPKQQHYLNLYKLGKGPLYSFYTPYHLCHFEVPLSVARLVLCGDAVIQPLDGPRVDVVATAKVPLSAGDVIDGLGGYKTYGQAERYEVSRAEGLLPIGLAEGCRVKRDLPRDAVLTYDDVEIPEGRLIDRLRAEQDAAFPVRVSRKADVPAL
ncbi:NAD(P)H-dependent oxidoreductase [Muricoccus pecuniae]|uniref:Putative homoserine dehydrogenase-like protein n=1 Tax=Muricoccus pecuniae TaxID=693023 RepID=A0A840Y569_9PROT|nr:Gfo/Idh/MocA family oxidoreductase [Roseomonas pecuniae]MBB5693929.1 putative homoserine dehydrogenase-like protein [Roseomonas pecuniae]